MCSQHVPRPRNVQDVRIKLAQKFAHACVGWLAWGDLPAFVFFGLVLRQ
jgi:hypothetical protein